MVEKIKKEIVHTKEYQNRKIEEFKSILDNIVSQEPDKEDIVKDVFVFFEDNFEEDKRNCDFVIVNNTNSISLEWREKDFELIVIFYGNLNWEYYSKEIFESDDLGNGSYSSNFKGTAPIINNNELIEDPTASPINIFLLNDNEDELISLEDEFEYIYSPLFTTTKSNVSVLNKVKIAWNTLYYDGPLSGYCYLNEELYYFDNIEESEFENKRMYAIYKISNQDKAKAYLEHYKNSFIKPDKKTLWDMKLKFSEIEKKIKTKLNGQDYRKKDAEAHKQWKNNLETVGYFVI